MLYTYDLLECVRESILYYKILGTRIAIPVSGYG